MKKYLAVILIVLSLITCCGCGQKEKNKTPLGVWWWDSEMQAEPYLAFAQDNGVTEIYYCDSDFDEDTQSFIKSANDRGIKVYWLAGEYQWLRDNDRLYKKMDKYCAYQASGTSFRFEGVHLDIEPHQDPAFSTERTRLLESLVSLTYNLSVKYTGVKFDYDIPFWIDDEITFNGKTQPAYAHIIDNSNRTFLMSYRDTATAIYDVSKDEIEYATSVGKTLVLGVETYSREGDAVSFMEEGKQYMYGEIAALKEMLPQNFGVAIHQIKTWYGLKN